MKYSWKTKGIGIIAVDRSGSRSDFPYVIASVYSDKVRNFEAAIKEVKNSIKHEVTKGKNFKHKDFEKVIEIILSHNIKFVVYLVDREVYSHLRNVHWRKRWEQKLESVLWYKSCRLLMGRLKVAPSEIFYERTYSSDDTFDNLFKQLLNEKLNFKEVEIGSKYSPYIMIADWMANFFHRSPAIRNSHKNFVIRCEPKYIESMLWKVLTQKSNTGSRLVGDTAAEPRNDQTINMIYPGIFKVFALWRKLPTEQTPISHQLRPSAEVAK